LIDGGAAGREVRNHLDGDFGRIGRDALCAHAVIAGIDQHLDVVETRRVAPLPMGEPGDQIFQAAQAARRLGELRLAVRNRRRCHRMSHRQIETGDAQFGKRGERGHWLPRDTCARTCDADVLSMERPIRQMTQPIHEGG
jgi:hypothetical protein